MSTPVLEVRDLAVRYPGFTLGPLSFAVVGGEQVALLGANGAGKTTLLRALAGRLPRRIGTARILGRDLLETSPDWFAQIGYAGEAPAADPMLRVREWLDFLADVHPRWSVEEAGMLVDRLQVDVEKRIGQLSRGNQVKVAIICAEASRPPLLVLDEPTNGLDPVIRQELITLLRERFEADQERALLFSSHLLEDVEALCDRAILIRDGRLLREVAGADLRQARSEGRLTALVADVLESEDEA